MWVNNVCVCAQLCPAVCGPADYSLPGSSLHFPGKNAGVGCHFLLQGISPTQGSNPRLSVATPALAGAVLYHQHHLGSRICAYTCIAGFPGGSAIKNPPAYRRPGFSPWVGKIPLGQGKGRGESLEGAELATFSSILAWKSPWIEEPDRLQSMGSQRAGHNWVINKGQTCVTEF